jgi:cysteine desulfurase
MQRVYFDNAATTPMDKEVIAAMLPYMEQNFGNPSAIHSYGRETRAAIEKARKTVAKILNVSTSEIFFTSGGTESNNTAIRCSIESYNLKHIITSRIEHHCVMHTVEDLEKNHGITVHYVNLDDKGHFDLDHLDELLGSISERCLVTLMHANNETGNLMDIDRAAEICKSHNAIFHSDTVQTIGHYNFDLQKTPVQFISGSAHKFHGPKGVGFLFIRHDVKIHPLIFGGGQERNLRAGTENVSGIIGLAKAMELAYITIEKDKTYIQDIKNYLVKKLRENISDVKFNGDFNGSSLYTVLNASFPPSDKSEMLLFILDIAGICTSGGSACSSGSNKGSHVLEAMGVDPQRANIRFSFSKFNNKQEVDVVVAKLKELYPAKVMA